MSSCLRHRGPDDSGIWLGTFPLRERRFSIELGHRRLAIIDPSPAGHQPMRSRDGKAVACTNGEIYNFRELRTELESEGVAFSTQSDTEVLVEGFRTWDLKILDRLHGMFAFALWDDPARRLLLVRDRVGIKPLFYAQIGDRLVFASELQALRRMNDFPNEIDRQALSHFLAYGYVAGPRTIYRAARRLMPGEYLEWRQGEVKVAPYWSLPETSISRDSGAGRDWVVDELESLLRESVRERLVSDVPLGAFLSGGVDSSAVVSMMTEVSSSPVQTFTVGFDQPDFDESTTARQVARHLGTDHHEIRISNHQAIDLARELPLLFDEPFADASALPTILVSRFAREQVKVVLSGDGGDELFGGYSRYRRIARFEQIARIPGWIRGPLALIGSRLAPRPKRGRILLLGAPSTTDFAETITSRFDERTLLACTAATPRAGREIFRRQFALAGHRSAARRAMIADVSTYLVDDILTKLDRASMSIALEARVPLLDHRLVSFALSLPLEALWDGRSSKVPLRKLAARRVPARLLDRPKSGFGFPLEGLLSKELDRWTDHYLDSSRLQEEGLLEPGAVSRLLALTDRSDRVAIRGLWNLLCFERWFAVRERHEAMN